ncbi:MAG: BTAD domain-containing putative transcriptional regulator, partial [Nitriliruptorales bacterium]|nr:BTAD domain-containing putative transcriptional regulator [Nitriliruptorales bacterium]
MGATIEVAGGALLDDKFRPPDMPSLERHRVLESLRPAVEHPLTLVIAPAGSGKTTTLVQYVESSDLDYAWYRAERTESHPEQLLQHLEHALRPLIGGLPSGWTDAADAGRALHAVDGQPRTLLVIDDLHELRGTPAEGALQHLISHLPDWLGVLAATRHSPAMNLSQLRLSGQLVEISGDVLRWRTWEVERLFREFYREPLRPEDAAHLTVRTEGWVAGLQLFHLASAELPVARRSQLIEQLHARPGLVRDYLAQNVLDRLPSDLVEFMVDTCVLGRLEPALCDQLCGRMDSQSYLAELNERKLFTLPREDGNGYRYHEVLRAYLDRALQERDGPAATSRRYRRAGDLLEEAGAAAEALYAYARAESWAQAARLLGNGFATRDPETHVIQRLPDWFVSSDPWLQLARARALLGDGRIESAVEAYRSAEEQSRTSATALTCRRERAAVHEWLGPHQPRLTTLTGILRSAVGEQPRDAVELALQDGSANGLLVASTAALLAGSIDQARQLARRATSRTDAEVLTLAAGRVLEHLADLAGGRSADPADVLSAAASFEQLDLPWLARLARAIAGSQTGTPVPETEAFLEVLEQHEDPWGPPMVALAAGIASVIRGEPQLQWLVRAGARFHELGASTLEVWAYAWRAFGTAYLVGEQALPTVQQARRAARSVGVPGAEAVAEFAMTLTGEGDDSEARAHALADELGLALPSLREPVPEGRSFTRVTCFGGLSLVLEGREVDVDELKPQARSALALLVLQGGKPIHRERLTEALWPGEDPAVANRRLQVLVSTLRRHLEPQAEAGNWTYLLRKGEAYVLAFPDDVQRDVSEFDAAIEDALRARTAGDVDGEQRALELAFGLYDGELLPEAGPADWIVDERDRYCSRFVRVAQLLAARYAEEGRFDRCIDACLAGLEVDRYRSRLWTLLAAAHRGTGDPAAAART